MGRNSLDGFVNWLAGTPWSIALHESLYMYSITESAHVMAIMLFVGTIMMVDLRLLGVAYRDTPVSEMTTRILPWTVAGFIVLVITGVALFYAIPIRTWHSIWFRIKCVLLVIGMINITWFTFKVERDREKWDLGHPAQRPDLGGDLPVRLDLRHRLRPSDRLQLDRLRPEPVALHPADRRLQSRSSGYLKS